MYIIEGGREGEGGIGVLLEEGGGRRGDLAVWVIAPLICIFLHPNDIGGEGGVPGEGPDVI